MAANPGILVVDEEHKFVFHRANKAKTTSVYRCMCYKAQGVECPVVATLKQTVVGEDDVDDNHEEGELMMKLAKVKGVHNHPSFVARIIADTLKVKMATMAGQNLDLSAPKIREKILMEAMAEYEGNLWGEINLELGKDEALEKMIKRCQRQKIGSKAKNRDEKKHL